MTAGHRAADPKSGAFHAKDGWYFRRCEDGSVTIWAADDGAEVTLPPDTWESVVAAVSAEGGTSLTFAAAKALHLRGAS